MAAMLTLKELNGMTCSQNCLQLLRVLNTSDLTFMYDLLKGDTLRDITKMCEDLLDADEDDAQLTEDERVEFRGYCLTLKTEYVRR